MPCGLVVGRGYSELANFICCILYSLQCVANVMSAATLQNVLDWSSSRG